MPIAPNLRVAIIGAGLGGIAMAVKLSQANHRNFVIFEKASAPGGVWRDNQYPGCAVDVPSHAYSYSFIKYAWPRTHATQRDLLGYIEHVIDRFDLRDKFAFDTEVVQARWDHHEDGYELHASDGSQHRCNVLVSALGFFNVPKIPEWPGSGEFGQPIVHTAQWDDGCSIDGKVVAVAGTGSSGVQVVPAIASRAKQVLVFQREPGWINPKHEREYSPIERAIYARAPLAQKVDRARLFLRSARHIKGFDANSRQQAVNRQAALELIEASIADPELRARVTPGFPWGCKRPVMSTEFYQALTRENVELIPHAISSLGAGTVVDDSGIERDVDMLIASTGFETTNYLASLDVIGPGAQSIHVHWRGRPSAFLGITVPGFANFFMLYGPNTNGGYSIIAQLERQAEVVLSTLRRMSRRGWSSVDTSSEAHERYGEWLDERIRRNASAMAAGCNNYYYTPDGANVTQWPMTHAKYYLLTKLLPRLAIGTQERRERRR